MHAAAPLGITALSDAVEKQSTKIDSEIRLVINGHPLSYELSSGGEVVQRSHVLVHYNDKVT
jgi:hypothetical protein